MGCGLCMLFVGICPFFYAFTLYSFMVIVGLWVGMVIL